MACEQLINKKKKENLLNYMQNFSVRIICSRTLEIESENEFYINELDAPNYLNFVV